MIIPKSTYVLSLLPCLKLRVELSLSFRGERVYLLLSLLTTEHEALRFEQRTPRLLGLKVMSSLLQQARFQTIDFLCCIELLCIGLLETLIQEFSLHIWREHLLLILKPLFIAQIYTLKLIKKVL